MLLLLLLLLMMAVVVVMMMTTTMLLLLMMMMVVVVVVMVLVVVMMMMMTTTMIMMIIMTTMMMLGIMIVMTTMVMLFWDLHNCSTRHSIFLILSRAPVNRGMPSIVEKKQQKTKTLTDGCSAPYWTQELGLTCLEGGRRAASNEPSCFSRR